MTASKASPASQRALFLALVRGLFSSASIIRDAKLDVYTYSGTATSSNIQIETVERFKLDELGKRPAVLLAYMGSKPQSFTMRDGLIAKNTTTNVQTRAFWMEHTFQYRCVAEEAATVLHIGSEILIRFMELLPVIKRDYNIKKLVFSGLSAAQRVEEYNNNWACVVGFISTTEWESTIDTDSLPARLQSADNYMIG